MESTLCTIKEINSIAGCSQYTVACLCTVDQLMLVKETPQRVFVNAEIIFLCDDSNKCEYVPMSYITPYSQKNSAEIKFGG